MCSKMRESNAFFLLQNKMCLYLIASWTWGIDYSYLAGYSSFCLRLWQSQWFYDRADGEMEAAVTCYLAQFEREGEKERELFSSACKVGGLPQHCFFGCSLKIPRRPVAMYELPTRTAFTQFQKPQDQEIGAFYEGWNVKRRILKLQICERVGWVHSQLVNKLLYCYPCNSWGNYDGKKSSSLVRTSMNCAWAETPKKKREDCHQSDWQRYSCVYSLSAAGNWPLNPFPTDPFTNLELQNPL